MNSAKDILENDKATFKQIFEDIKKDYGRGEQYFRYSSLENKINSLDMHPQDALIQIYIEHHSDDRPGHAKEYQSYMLRIVLDRFVKEKNTPATPFVRLMQKRAPGPLLDELHNFSGDHPEKLIRFKMATIGPEEESIRDDRLCAHYADNSAQGSSEKQDCNQRQKAVDALKPKLYHSMIAYNEASAIRKQMNRTPEVNLDEMAPN